MGVRHLGDLCSQCRGRGGCWRWPGEVKWSVCWLQLVGQAQQSGVGRWEGHSDLAPGLVWSEPSLPLSLGVMEPLVRSV